VFLGRGLRRDGACDRHPPHPEIALGRDWIAANEERLIDGALGAIAAQGREDLVLGHVVDALLVGSQQRWVRGLRALHQIERHRQVGAFAVERGVVGQMDDQPADFVDRWVGVGIHRVVLGSRERALPCGERPFGGWWSCRFSGPWADASQRVAGQQFGEA
jgi:hypothetical protein